MSFKRHVDVDPDYEISEGDLKRIKLKEQEERKNSVEKIKEIIDHEFTSELENRQIQLELIQKQLNKAQKFLHTLRYVLITSYYNRKELFYASDEQLTNSDDMPIMHNQNRIHPAVKKLLGSSMPIHDFYQPRISRKKQISQLSKSKLSETNETEITSETNNVFVNSDNGKSTVVSVNKADSVRNRKKSKHRIIVGNISKWMPSEHEEDGSTHKWMVYVRGPKESPDITDFVQQVVFYLHPSYKPNDVIELKDGPFHLSRRGWGEFPLRVQIFFKCSLNKHVDIIHNLKLDRTYTGRQTLGNETVIDLFLYDYSITKNVSTNDEWLSKSNNEIDQSSPTNLCFDHNYCSTTVKIEKEEEAPEETSETKCEKNVNYLFRDHSYCISSATMENNEINTTSVTSVEEETPKIVTSDGRIILIKSHKIPQQSLLKRTFQKNSGASESTISLINYDKYKISFPLHKFTTVDNALPYIFKRLPLITELALDSDYKCLYPYAVASLNQYKIWNIGKRLSAEWGRAKTVQRIISASNLLNNQDWTTKSLLLYARSYGYTPFANYNIFKKISGKPDYRQIWQQPTISFQIPTIHEREKHIDVVDCSEETASNTPKIVYDDIPYAESCVYIKQIVFDCGIILKPEEIVEGVLFNGAERMLLQAFLSLAEHFIRKARCNAVLAGEFSEENNEITIKDIYAVIEEVPAFKAFLKK